MPPLLPIHRSPSAVRFPSRGRQTSYGNDYPNRPCRGRERSRRWFPVRGIPECPDAVPGFGNRPGFGHGPLRYCPTRHTSGTGARNEADIRFHRHKPVYLTGSSAPVHAAPPEIYPSLECRILRRATQNNRQEAARFRLQAPPAPAPDATPWAASRHGVIPLRRQYRCKSTHPYPGKDAVVI